MRSYVLIWTKEYALEVIASFIARIVEVFVKSYIQHRDVSKIEMVKPYMIFLISVPVTTFFASLRYLDLYGNEKEAIIPALVKRFSVQLLIITAKEAILGLPPLGAKDALERSAYATLGLEIATALLANLFQTYGKDLDPLSLSVPRLDGNERLRRNIP